MIEQQPVFEAIDKMVERVNRFKIDPQFTQQVEERHGKVPDFTLDDQRILRHLMVLTAYSNNANAEKVTRLVEGKVFESIFQKYFVEKTAELTAESIVGGGWKLPLWRGDLNGRRVINHASEFHSKGRRVRRRGSVATQKRNGNDKHKNQQPQQTKLNHRRVKNTACALRRPCPFLGESGSFQGNHQNPPN